VIWIRDSDDCQPPLLTGSQTLGSTSRLIPVVGLFL
jgi:hypothetical protein